MDSQAATSTQRDRAIRIIKIMLFSASIVPCFVGAALAHSQGSVDLTRFVLVTLGLFLGQAAGDYLYYYFTNFHSDDRDAHTKIFAGWRPLFTDAIIPGPATVYAGFACLGLAAIIGLYFVSQIGTAVIPLAVAGAVVAVFFTPFMLRGYKEPVIFLTFGPLALAGVYLVLTRSLSWTPVIVSLPIAFFVTAVAYLKSARLAVRPSGNGEVTVDVRVEHIVLLFALGYLCLIGAVMVGVMPPWTLLALASLVPAAAVVRAVGGQASSGTAYLWATIRSIIVLVIAGTGICIGYLI